MTFERETIAAIATGLTDSGIGIIRISGSDAVKQETACFALLREKLCWSMGNLIGCIMDILWKKLGRCCSLEG